MSDITFQIGDVVRLKSGGPNMTIDNIGLFIGQTKTKAACAWFDTKNEVKKEIFDPAVLEKVEQTTAGRFGSEPRRF